MNQLILRDPSDRLGSHGVEEIKEHPFFEGFDWAGLEKMRTVPPYKPKVSWLVTAGAEEPLRADQLSLEARRELECEVPGQRPEVEGGAR